MEKKKIVVAVTGGIAVYKAVTLVSRLVQDQYDVRVIMTPSATKFVTPLTFQVMSKNDVYTDTFDEKVSSEIAHIALSDWADAFVIVPATANVIGKLANGIADEMVTTTLLATQAPVFIAPAMNVDMYANRAVVRNMERLREDGYRFIEPDDGYLACGYVGKGRLAEPEHIKEVLDAHFEPSDADVPLRGKRVVVTAGPTLERIDPVRYVSNFSSGKMGFAMATAARDLGADVTLIAGPVSLETPDGVTRIDVESAADMFEAVISRFDEADLVVKSAAVVDYRPAVVADQKMKKQEGDASIPLERTTDILKTLGERKKGQLLVGFAAETNDAIAYGRGKLEKKNADYIIVNDVTNPEGGFGSDTNVVTLLGKEGFEHDYPATEKEQLARLILREIVAREWSM